MKKTIAIIFMTDEEPATAMAVASVLPQMTKDDTLLLLHNGSNGPRFNNKYGALDGVKYFESDTNLGVASGRNLLLTQPECQEADLIYFVDSDAIVPQDYLEKMAEFMNSDPEIGVAGPVVLDFKKVRSELDDEGLRKHSAHFDTAFYEIDTPILQEMFGTKLTSGILDHVGTNPNWQDAYMNNQDMAERMFGTLGIRGKEHFSIGLKFHAESVEALNTPDSKISVTNVAGCCQVFRGELLREIGIIYDLYSPYGHEDVDFCLKAIHAGKTNYTTNITFMLHRTDERHDVRAQVRQNRRKQVNESRVRTILEYRWQPKQFPAISYQRVLKRAFSSFLANKNNYPHIAQQMTNEMVGVKHAANQLAVTEGSKFGEIVKAGLAEFDDDLGFYNLLEEDALRAADLESESNQDRVRLRREKLNPRRVKARNAQRFDFESIKMGISELESFAERKGNHKAARKDRLLPHQLASIAAFKDIHKGERCFIIGNGPSLKKTDFNLLRNEFTFGVNGLFYMFDDIGFTPTYYVVEDNHVVDDNLERIVSFPAKAKFFPGKYQDAIGPDANHYFLPTDWEFYYKSTPHFETPRFSRDLSEVAYVGQTVTYLNMQLAHYMGFSEVYLIGVDFNYQVPNSSKIDGFTIVSQEDDPNHFHPEYFGKGKKWHFPKLENCEKVYKHANEVFLEDGRILQDATIGGKLKVYKKKNFYRIFGKPLRLKTPNAPQVSLVRDIIAEQKLLGKDVKISIDVPTDYPHREDLESIQSAYSKSQKSSTGSTRVNVVMANADPNLLELGKAETGINIVLGMESVIHSDDGTIQAAPLLKRLMNIHETVYLHKDIGFGSTGLRPRILDKDFGLSLDAENTSHMNPLMALALVDQPVTKTRTISTDFYSCADNIFRHDTQGSPYEDDYSLVAALLELNRPVALHQNKLLFAN